MLESLEAKELLVLSGSGEGEKWTFRSDLVREVAYSTLTKADRARAHAGHRRRGWRPTRTPSATSWSTASPTTTCAPPSWSTSSARSTGCPTTSPSGRCRWLERAAGRADQAEIPVVAERLYAEGLRLLAGAHGPRHRAFLTGRARALAGLREIAPARADALAAVDESRQAGDEGRADLGRALLVLADVEQKEAGWAASEARPRRGGRGLRRARRRVAARPRCCACAASRALFRHEYAAATGLLEQALAGFEALDDRRGVAWALQNLAWCAFYAGPGRGGRGAAAQGGRHLRGDRRPGRPALGPRPAGLDPLPAGPRRRGRARWPRPSSPTTARGGDRWAARA